MAQKQAAEGKAPTIKDQREQEVMNMTKQELAQQQGALMQQQNKEQQQGLQALMQQRGRPGMPAPQMPQMPRPPQAAQMGGIASRPAPNMARLAGGGIVAFAGEDGSYVGGSTFGAEGFAPSEQATEVVETGVIEVPVELAGKVGLSQIKDIREGKYGRTKEEILAAFGIRPAPARAPAPTPARAPAPTAPAAAPAGGPAPMMPPQQNQGIATLPRPTPQAATSTMDPFAKQKDEEKRVSEVLGLTPEQRAVYDKNIKGLEALYKEEMDPEERRKRELNQFLLGAANRSSFGSVMAGGTAAAENERRRSFATRLKGTEDVQKKLEDVIGIERGVKKEGILAGQKIGEMAKDVRGQDLLTKDKALDRVVDELKIRAQNAYTQAVADQTNVGKMDSVLRSINADIARAENTIYERAASRIDTLKMQIQGEKDADKRKKLEADLKKEYDELRLMTEAATESMKAQRDDLLSKLRSGGAPTLSKEEEALVNQFKDKK